MNIIGLQRTRHYVVLEQQGDHHKHEVETKHRYPQQLGHLPARDHDAHEDGDQHREEQDD